MDTHPSCGLHVCGRVRTALLPLDMLGELSDSAKVKRIVALLLERNPAMTPTDVKAALKTASRIPGKTAGTFDRKWGVGLLDGARL